MEGLRVGGDELSFLNQVFLIDANRGVTSKDQKRRPKINAVFDLKQKGYLLT